MIKKTSYKPPYIITPEIIHLISEISEILGRFSVINHFEQTPMLRRGNHIRSIQASLAIENNTLTLEQVTAIINGKRILGHPREIQEVKNAFSVYETIEKLNPYSEKDLLKAHALLMSSLVNETGQYRTGGVGIVKGRKVIHIAPPADHVAALMNDLLSWLKNTNEHPLITSSVFHYEFEFIHPFADGNGRMGRLWQTLILSQWKPLFSYIPVETVVRNRQEEYYRVLGKSDHAADSTEFIKFMLKAILEVLRENVETDQVDDQVTDQVAILLKLFNGNSLATSELMQKLDLTHRPTFRNNYLHPALYNGLIEMTVPDKPNSRLQKYRLTKKGIAFIHKKN
ncbi:MAG: Fic family protein [Candidatus Wallbacteria bacterium]